MGCPLWLATISVRGLEDLFSDLDVEAKLAFIEHNSVLVYLVQETSVTGPGGQSGVCCEHNVEVLQIAGVLWTVSAVEPARPERVGFDVPANISLY